MKTKCVDCSTPLEWKGKGAKPKRCPGCKAARTRVLNAEKKKRDRAHAKGKPASKWGDFWLTGGKAVRRDRRQVWGSSGDSDETVTARGGVFTFIGREGLPLGTSTREKSLAGVLQTRQDMVLDDPDAQAWLRTHAGWWRFESFAHETLYMDVTDSTAVHAAVYVDEPDESSPKHKCSWCGERRILILAGEFCSPECMAAYVHTWGADGIETGKVVQEDDRVKEG